MAKQAWFERNKKKIATVKKYAALRAELKARKDYAALSKLPRNASPSRVVNRCRLPADGDLVVPVGPVSILGTTSRTLDIDEYEVTTEEVRGIVAEAAMKVAKMAYLPDVSVIGGYANQTAASYVQPNIGYVGITGTYTFWEWGKKRDVKRQRLIIGVKGR